MLYPVNSEPQDGCGVAPNGGDNSLIFRRQGMFSSPVVKMLGAPWLNVETFTFYARLLETSLTPGADPGVVILPTF